MITGSPVEAFKSKLKTHLFALTFIVSINISTDSPVCPADEKFANKFQTFC